MTVIDVREGVARSDRPDVYRAIAGRSKELGVVLDGRYLNREASNRMQADAKRAANQPQAAEGSQSGEPCLLPRTEGQR